MRGIEAALQAPKDDTSANMLLLGAAITHLRNRTPLPAGLADYIDGVLLKYAEGYLRAPRRGRPGKKITSLEYDMGGQFFASAPREIPKTLRSVWSRKNTTARKKRCVWHRTI